MSAILSTCKKYRYKLYRDVDLINELTIAYFGINPSTADAMIDDPTVRKLKGFTQRHNGKQFIVGNVFAYRATDVKELSQIKDPVGVKNLEHVKDIIEEADLLVPCWGNRTKVRKSLRVELDNMLIILKLSGKPVLCFGKTSTGDPAHPLMLSYSTRLTKWQ